MHEATDGAIRFKADRSNILIGVAELPAANFSEGGRWDVPHINVPSVMSQTVLYGRIDVINGWMTSDNL